MNLFQVLGGRWELTWESRAWWKSNKMEPSGKWGELGRSLAGKGMGSEFETQVL